jgi:CHAT domain-containing protein
VLFSKQNKIFIPPQVNQGDPPRIWWCPTGPLAFLPIHAAGQYDKIEVGHKVSDYVVSSYCPTLSSLLEPSRPNEQPEWKMATVAQPFTPDASPIPETEDEVKRIGRVGAGLSIVSLIGENATVDRVSDAMKNTHWIHLACHGQQSSANAMDSGLLLHDGNLKLSNLVRESLPHAEFAFLSACQTATGDEAIAEESAHLAGGMLLAGYRGVIATMWSINDGDAPQVAEDVYKRMLKDGKPNRMEAARGLHEAVKRLRESGAGFLSWVPFIHVGR